MPSDDVMPMKSCLKTTFSTPVLSDFDDEETTDIGDSIHSETEGSVVSSASECGSVGRVGRRLGVTRCPFGGTPLETIPGTPVGAAKRSPLTINPSGYPMTPPAMRSVKRRTTRERVQLQEAALSQVCARIDSSTCVEDQALGHCRHSDEEFPSSLAQSYMQKENTYVISTFGVDDSDKSTNIRHGAVACTAEWPQATSWGCDRVLPVPPLASHALHHLCSRVLPVPPLAPPALLTIGPDGEPSSPTKMRSAQRRAALDALKLCAR